jgi:hypothetical protein
LTVWIVFHLQSSRIWEQIPRITRILKTAARIHWRTRSL